jgi:hypothetical protein
MTILTHIAPKLHEDGNEARYEYQKMATFQNARNEYGGETSMCFIIF